MKLAAGQTVLLTGASGGLGVFMAGAFASLGSKLALVAYPGAELKTLSAALQKQGCHSVTYNTDLRQPAQRNELLQQVEKDLGAVDVLINNAGVENTAPYHELTEDGIREVISVNLEAPMTLSLRVLPGMLERRRGHIVNISSLAGKSGPAFQEPYAATKAALVEFTSSLRATYRGTGVSASVVIPGFVEAGIYAKLKRRTGCSAPAMLGTSSPEAVARAVIRVVERDLPEVIVNPIPVRPLLAFRQLFPSAGEWTINMMGSNEFFHRVVEAERRRKV